MLHEDISAEGRFCEGEGELDMAKEKMVELQLRGRVG